MPCWPWTGSTASGRMVPYPFPERPYRLAYGELVGPIPAGHHLHHRCENPLCCNPAHLEPMTNAEHKRHHMLKGNRRATEQTQTAANKEAAVVADSAG